MNKPENVNEVNVTSFEQLKESSSEVLSSTARLVQSHVEHQLKSFLAQLLKTLGLLWIGLLGLSSLCVGLAMKVAEAFDLSLGQNLMIVGTLLLAPVCFLIFMMTKGTSK